MKLNVLGPPLSESVVLFLPSFLFFRFYEDRNNECPMTKFEQFSKCTFGEICSQHLTSPYMDLVSRYITKYKEFLLIIKNRTS